MKKLLIVEPSREQRAVMIDALCELPGLEIRAEAGDLGAAIRCLARDAVDLVIAGPSTSSEQLASVEAAARERGLPPVIVLDASFGLADLVAAVHDVARAPADDRTREEAPGPLSAADSLLTGLPRGARLRDQLRLDRARRLRSGGRLAHRLTVDAGGPPAGVQELALAPLLQAMVPELAQVLPEGIEVSVIVEHATPHVRGVPNEIERLVLTSVLDASERMPWGGTIWLIVQREGTDHVRLEVLDTGSGVPAAARPHQVTRALALDSARGEIERHGGLLRSVPQSHGSASVQLDLPAV